MDLVTKFWNFCHTLRHEGVDYSDYIEELTCLLFLKLAEERKIVIPPGCAWNDLLKYDKEDLLKKYNDILTELSKEKSILGDIFSQPIAKIRQSSSLKKLLILINDIKWTNYDADVLGAMFEGLLEKAANESKKGAGQYFTPRPLIETIVKVLRPDPFESPDFKISDVACGTGGFIITSYEWWKANNNLKSLKPNERKKLFNHSYFGQELVVRPRRMAQMNLYLHGIEPNIKLGDTIYEPLGDNTFDCILTNPPFGNRGANQIPDRKDFKIKTSNKQLNFVQHVYSCLKKNGRSAIVLPDSVLSEDAFLELWKYLMPSCNIHTILRLPDGTFLPYANVKAVVIFLQKGVRTSRIWVYDARTNVKSVNKGRPLSREHFSEFAELYGKNPNGGKRKDQGKNSRSREFDLDYIKKRNFNLDITWLKEDTDAAVSKITDPQFLVGETISELENLAEELREILNFLETDDKKE